MADNSYLPARGQGSPNTIIVASEDIGSVQYQRVKLVDGTPGSTTVIGATSNGLKVDVQSVSGTTGFKIADGPNLDAFSRLRVSDATMLFSVQSQYDAEPLKMEGGATGTGVAPAHQANSRMVKLSATAGTGVSFLQSYQYVPYQPGKSQLIFVTGLLGAGVAAVTKDFGYFDSANGIFLRQNGASGLQLVRRTSTGGSVANNAVPQADWNLDTLNGSGASGITLNPETVFILVIDLQFLAMGRVRCGFDIGGNIVYAHEFRNANVLDVPYMQMATLPVQALLTATASVAGANCYFKCASVNSEGGFEDASGITLSTAEGTVTAASGARTHILSLRPLTTFNTFTNRSLFALEELELLVTGSNPVYWEMCVGAAFTVAPTYANVNTTYSAFEYGTGGTFGNLTNGIVIASGYASASAAFKTVVSKKLTNLYPITLDRAGAARALGTISVLVSGLGGTSVTRAAINFLEVR